MIPDIVYNEITWWLFGAYVAGSVVTYLLILKLTFIDAAGKTIDSLVEQGFLRTRKSKDGELEILKWDAKDE